MKTWMHETRSRLPLRLLAIGALALLLPTLLFAAGSTEEDDFQQVEGTGNWEYTIDVSDREPGKYNILVRARDEAGNVSLGGPYNIYVDPESDLPEVSVSYPATGQAVGDRLFVVGTAVDDDAVGYVEVQVNDGRFVRASGTDYWSVIVEMTNLPDGPHTIRVRAVDINGVEGNPVEVPVRLDTTAPLATVGSHESGVLVSRRTTVEGTVEDANGIDSLTLVAGDSRETLRLRGGRDEAPRFSFDIDPREMDEGATVWWLESVDGTGARGVTPFLFFVDTSPPELEVLYPTAEDRVDAQLRFIGRVSDLVGVASLAYELSTGEAGEIELVPGDPFWSLSVDLPAGSRGNVTATFTVTDVAGNESSERLRLALDAEGDMPTVTVASPAEGAIIEGGILSGHVADDDGPARVVYVIDGGAEQEINLASGATDGFAIELPDLAPGSHEIRIRAVDRYGTEGEEVRRRFAVTTPLPTIRITDVLRGETTEAYEPGFTVAASERASLIAEIDGTTTLPARISYAIGASSGRANVDANGRVTIPLPRSDVGGPIRIDVFAQNELARVSRTVGFYTQLPAVAEEQPAPVITDVIPRGLYLVTGDAVTPEGATNLRDTPITLARGASLRLLAVGGRPSDPTLSADVDFLRVSTSGDFVVLEATADGAIAGLRVAAQVSGVTVTSAPIGLRTSVVLPRIAIPTAVVGRRFAEAPALTIDASAPTGVADVRVAVVGAGAIGVEAGAGATGSPATATEGGYTITPSLPATEGASFLRITATDTGGLSNTMLVPVAIDRTAPSLTIVTPPDGVTVNGTVTVLALLSEPGTTSSLVVVGDDSETAGQAITPDLLVGYRVTTSEERQSVSFRLVDTAGNERETTVNLETDFAADIPTLQLQVPVEGGLVKDEFRLSGVLLDDDAPASITYRVNQLEPRTVATEGTFDIDVAMTGLEDGDHTVTVFGTDIGGVQSEPIVRTFALSRSEPVSVVTAPNIDSYQREQVVITGTSSDANGIASVFVSTDNGASFQRAIGTEEWSYRLDTTLLDDGTHSVLVRATDGAGETGLLSTTINVDNTAPVLELSEPDDGVTVSGRFLIDGRGEDDALLRVRLVAQPLSTGDEDGAPPIELAVFDEPGPFAYSVNASALPPGWYNLRVEAEDRAGNTRRISRNLRVEPAQITAAPEILVPADGASLSHRFKVTVVSPPEAGPVTILANDRPLGVIEIDDAGIGSLLVEPGTLASGEVELSLRTEATEDGAALVSAVHRINLEKLGPWLVVDDPGFLSYVRDRPFITGRAGYEIVLPEGEDRDAERARKDELARHEIERVEVSLDNGRTFTPARGTETWDYRLETTELTDGRQNLIVRARFADGATVVERYSIIVDETPPTVRLLEPRERETFNDSIRVVGVTTDDNALSDVAVVLREGDKARYEVPGFVQGLYIDAHVLGATYWDLGAGLTFFDNNVRLQGQIGVSPPGRFSGLVLGAKLLANVASLPASFFFGPDLDWLSGALAIGANFSYFTMSEDTIGFTDEGLVLAGMVAQLEFPIVTIPDLRVFNTYAFYTEAQLWFISSDVEAGTAFRLGFGVRADVF